MSAVQLLLIHAALCFQGAAGDGKPAPAAPQATSDGSCCRPPAPPVDPAKLPKDRKSVALRMKALELTETAAPFVGDGRLKELEAQYKTFSPDAAKDARLDLLLALGNARLNDGSVEGAIECFQGARAILEQPLQRFDWLYVMRRLALCWMRIGERANCVGHHNQDSCIFPLKDGAIHVDKKGSEGAIEVLLQLLKVAPGDLPAIWLLNVAHMTLGTYPDGVPKRFRLPPSSFESEYPMPRMFDVAVKKGIRMFGRAGGSCIDDFDGDGRPDVICSSMDLFDPLRYFHQKPDGTFEEIAEKTGLIGQCGGINFYHFDANNDGRLDLYVPRGAWMGPFGRIPNSLLIQQPDGTFVDRTKEAGIEIEAPSQVAVAADIDNDGDLDLFLGYESIKPPNSTEVLFSSHLFLNKGDATFEDVTDRAGVRNDRFCKGAAFGDYDGDRFPDLFISNMESGNRLFHNNRDGTFTEVTADLHITSPKSSFGCWFFDYNNDGALDLYFANYSAEIRVKEICAWYRNGTPGNDSQRLYENDGHGGFRDVSKARGLDRPVFPMGSNVGDVDNDGWLDIYLGTGDPDLTSLWPNIMYRNDRGERFQDVTTATGTGHLQKGHGVSFGDIDNDGDLDLFEQLGGAVKDDAFQSVLFENPGHGNHFLSVNIVGHKTNRFGVGVRIRAMIDEPTGKRSVYSTVGTNSSFGGNSYRQTIGLGKATKIETLEVYWPTTDKTDRFNDVPLDRFIVVEEGVGWREAPPPKS